MGETKKICIITSDFRGDYNDDYVIGCEKEANYLGYYTEVFSMLQLSELYSNDEENVYSLIDYNNYAGVIYVAKNFSRRREIRSMIEDDLMENCSVPIVSIGKWLGDDSIKSDASEAFEMLTTHLIKDHNCQMIYFLGGDEGDNDGMRHQGFQHAFEKCGIPFNKESFLYGGYWIDCAEKLAKRIAYGQIIKPEAVVCYNDTIAYALIKNLYHYGLRVPEDIIVTGFDGGSAANNPILPITTVSANYEYWGRMAVAKLYEKITGNASPVVRPNKLEINYGVSCGCGVKKSTDLRLRFELQEKKDTEAMQFRNSFYEEKAYSVTSKAELALLLKNTIYLIPDNKCVSVNLINDMSGKAECIYMAQVIENAKSVSFTANKIYPKEFREVSVHNTHIIPLMFKSKFRGFLTVGYDDALVYGQQTKEYVQILANALEILDLRLSKSLSAPSIPTVTIREPVPVKEEEFIMEESPSSASNPEILMVIRNGITYKIKSDNVLYCEAFDRKISVVTKSSTYETKMKLFEIEELLKSKSFVRISKAILVNMNKVTSFKPDLNSTLLAYLTTGQELHVSRKYVADFKDKLKL